MELGKGVLDQEVGGRVAAAVADGDAAPFFEERQRDRRLRAGNLRQTVPLPVRGDSVGRVLVDVVGDSPEGVQAAAVLV